MIKRRSVIEWCIAVGVLCACGLFLVCVNFEGTGNAPPLSMAHEILNSDEPVTVEIQRVGGEKESHTFFASKATGEWRELEQLRYLVETYGMKGQPTITADVADDRLVFGGDVPSYSFGITTVPDIVFGNGFLTLRVSEGRIEYRGTPDEAARKFIDAVNNYILPPEQKIRTRADSQ